MSRARPGCPESFDARLSRLCGEAVDPNWRVEAEVGHFSPAAFAAIAAVAAVVAAGVSAYGTYQASQQQAAALEYNAALARQQAAYQARMAELQGKLLERQAMGALSLAEAQATLSEQQALAREAAGKIQEAAIRRNYDRTQSEVRAAIGKAGVDTTGSPLMVLMENADTVGQELAVHDYEVAVDVAGMRAGSAYARSEGALRAGSLIGEAAFARFGGLSRSAADLSQANLYGFQAGGVRTAGYLGVGSTLLSGASAAASPFVYSRYGNVGASTYSGRGDFRY